MKTPTSIISVTLAAMTLAACAAPIANWEHPTRPRDQWAADIAACRGNAELLIRRELAQAGDRRDPRESELEQRFRQFDARKRRNELFVDCVRDKGYVRATPGQRKA